MLRAIAAVIVGYIALSIWVMATMTGAWFVLGGEFAFVEDTTEASTGWCVVAVVLGFIGAMFGGFITAAIARSPTNRPVTVLAGLVLGIGLLLAFLSQGRAAGPMTGELSVWEAAGESIPPAWYAFTIPFVGMIGVMLGGRLKRRSSGR